MNAGPATHDGDGDGDGDGEADDAAVITPGGDVTIVTHTGEDEWTVVDEGHLNPDGSFESGEQQPAATGS